MFYFLLLFVSGIVNVFSRILQVDTVLIC